MIYFNIYFCIQCASKYTKEDTYIIENYIIVPHLRHVRSATTRGYYIHRHHRFVPTFVGHHPLSLSLSLQCHPCRCDDSSCSDKCL